MLTWGYDGVAHGDLRWWDGDQTINQLHWCAKHGFRATGLDLNQLAEPARCATILGLAKELSLRLHIGFHVDWWKLPVPEIHAQGETFLRTLDGYRGLDIPFISTDLGQTHRYDPQRPLAQQIVHLSTCFAPLAKRFAERGTPLAVHNGFDFAGEDLAALCQRTPGLGLLYDTGNVMVVGVDPLASAKAAAPFIVATHLKDHIVYPWNDPRGQAEGLHRQAFLVDGAALGEGHGRVAEVLRAIHAGHPDPQRIIWGWEVEPASGDNGQAAVDRSWAVCRAFEQEIA